MSRIAMYKSPNLPLGLLWRQPANPLVEVATQVPSQPEIVLSEDTETPETMACMLEATGNYKILRRLVPRTAEPRPTAGRIGLIIDLETTGLDTTRNEVLEIAAIKFGYADDRVSSIIGTVQGFQQPSAPIDPAITALTGITDAMVEGHHIDSASLEQFVSDTHIIIAHNAAFDRKVAERHWPFFANCHWACSATGIDWKAHGLSGARLAYLLSEYGLFHDAHRALDDCRAVLEILALDLPGTELSGLAALLDRARRPQHRVWADGAPFALKDTLKQRGYRWNDGTDGRPKAWYVDVDAVDAELNYLRKEIYRRDDSDIVWRTITSLDRFSTRI
ncbi:3'-5' exonuclease [Bradyrhizobium sp. 62]|uniref:3'-5' exonuclease n=1 Tax=Bradyrhizobium sp. 62 TaxID=1043588 RepID=UPI001FF8D3A0|nr:3'-5' exonuclease [Bradyrhizobium sp. 62]